MHFVVAQAMTSTHTSKFYCNFEHISFEIFWWIMKNHVSQSSKENRTLHINKDKKTQHFHHEDDDSLYKSWKESNCKNCNHTHEKT